MTKKNGRKAEGIVYSTNPDFEYNIDQDEEKVTLTPAQQKLKVVLDNKSRSGKTVTLVKGFVGTTDDLNDLGKLLKQKFGVGGSVKDGEILVQGDFRSRIVDFLEKNGYRISK
jgi:translation initiation factor 1